MVSPPAAADRRIEIQNLIKATDFLTRARSGVRKIGRFLAPASLSKITRRTTMSMDNP
jgi:hypothetical protein